MAATHHLVNAIVIDLHFYFCECHGALLILQTRVDRPVGRLLPVCRRKILKLSISATRTKEKGYLASAIAAAPQFTH